LRRTIVTAMSTSSWSRLVRFVPKSSPSKVLIGEPVNQTIDLGLASYAGDKIDVNVYDGSSVLDAGKETGKIEQVDRLLSPLSESEVGTIRCIGLNYEGHAKEGGFPIPKVPVVFLKPATCIHDPHPAKIIVPKWTIPSDSADFESELGVIISKDCKDVSAEEAMDYVLGYTSTNDVSSRESQFDQSQWCFSKGFDKASPAGPCIVSPKLIPDPSKLKLRGLLNGKVVQESGLDDLIFDVPQLISSLSRGTTLRAGCLILTGTPAGIGWMRDPKIRLQEGDEFRVEILPCIGTLINVVEHEK